MKPLNSEKIALAVTECYQYPDKKYLFRPDTAYPEYFFGETAVSSKKNEVYAAVREALYLLGLDEENYGTKDWNPLKDFIKPGDSVLVKPNLVMDINRGGGGTDCLYTQPAVVAPMLDYVLIALRGNGKIVIGDAPMQECKFERLIEESGYKALVQWYQKRGYNIDLVDFRELKSDVVNGVHIQYINDQSKGKVIDLGVNSEFADANQTQLDKMRITNYDPNLLKQHHNMDKHEYYISDYVLKADCIINMPKPKSHRKAGVTISLKNMVGINVRKEFLPHHTMGSVEEGGDEYLRKSKIHKLRSLILDKRNTFSAKKNYRAAKLCNYCCKACTLLLQFSRAEYSEGSWYGNKTISRTIADLNKIALYADSSGTMQSVPQRKMLIVADMIIGGEKEGPVKPSPKNVGMIAAGVNPVHFDEAVSTLMGFDIEKIPTLITAKEANRKYFFEGESYTIFRSNSNKYDRKVPREIEERNLLNFIPTSGWLKHIEQQP